MGMLLLLPRANRLKNPLKPTSLMRNHRLASASLLTELMENIINASPLSRFDYSNRLEGFLSFCAC
jgi:hypothetical protein